MHGERIKMINARQARAYNNYKNTKLKLLKTNAAIWFNKICKTRQLQPKYINIKINNNNPWNNKTKAFAIRYRINQEIKFLYCKKQKLNEQLYHLHVQCANYCNGIWQYMYDNIDTQVNHIMQLVVHQSEVITK
jgi:hypothetical protein